MTKAVFKELDALPVQQDTITGEGIAGTEDGADDSGAGCNDAGVVLVDCLPLILISGERGIDSTKDVGFS